MESSGSEPETRAGLYRIQMASRLHLVTLADYFTDLNRDNGVGGMPLFQPQPRGTVSPSPEKLEKVQRAADVPIGEGGWRRFWLALDAATGTVAGHVDLQAWSEPYMDHRVLLGMGVHREHRRRGLGRRLLQFVSDWAAAETRAEWIDLCVLAGNDAARALYASVGFVEAGIFRDKFRIDGESVDEIRMTKAVRRPSSRPAGHAASTADR